MLFRSSWAFSNQEAFWGRHRTDKDGQPIPPSGGWAGKWNREDWQSIAFLPSTLDECLRRLKYHPDAILNGWAELGWLETDSDRKSRVTKRLRINGDAVRVVVVSRVAIEDVEAA